MKKIIELKNNGDIRMTLNENCYLENKNGKGFIRTVLIIDTLYNDVWYEESYRFTKKEFEKITPKELIVIVNNLLKGISQSINPKLSLKTNK